MSIEKIKTMYGLRYAVVEDFTYQSTNEFNETVKKTQRNAVEYTVDKKPMVAIFPLNEEGLQEAKQVMASLKKSVKSKK